MFHLSDMVTCDNCLRPFNLKIHAFTGRDGDIETVGLKCPHCDTVYISYRTNTEIRELQTQVRKEMERFRKKIALGHPSHKAERRLNNLRRKLERVFNAFNAVNEPRDDWANRYRPFR